MNPYSQFISEIVRLWETAESYPLGNILPAVKSKPAEGAPKVMIFSPHPDDECIIGALPLRLLRELGMRVLNVAVTQGSRRERQQERYEELVGACNYLGFELLPTRDGGLEKISLKTREREPHFWRQSVERISEMLAANQPKVIFFPHEADGNSTHVGTHYLVRDALEQMGRGHSYHLIETEYWGQLADPNLLVESSAQDVTDLVTALTFHVGEVRRNPYHLRLPAWMMDNVRRGSEMVGRQGGASPDFVFATIYRYSRWQDGQSTPDPESDRYLSAYADLSNLFRD